MAIILHRLLMTPQAYTPQLFAANLPRRVACCDDLAAGVRYMPRADALKRAYSAPNPRRQVWCLLFDVDRPGAVFAAADANLPRPSWIAENPANGHAHLGYALIAPVSRSDCARLRPLRTLARIQHGMARQMDADPAFAGFLTKTPWHEKWRTYEERPDPYDFEELREWLPDNLPLPTRKGEILGLGRNCRLFDDLRHWAYRNRLRFDDFQRWADVVLAHAIALNTFAAPLPFSEVKATARSVTKWTWQHISAAGFSALQRKRAQRPRNRQADAKARARIAILSAMQGSLF